MEDKSYKYKTEAYDKKNDEKGKDVKKVAKNEAEAEAKSKSVALNINWNILYYPGYVEDDSADGKASALKDPGFTPKDILDKYFNEDEQEAFAAAKAKSEAEIKNKNINVVIYF